MLRSDYEALAAQSTSAPDVTLINEGDIPAATALLAMCGAAARTTEPAPHITHNHAGDEIFSRDIYKDLGYVDWRNFLGLIDKAKNMIANGVADGRITDRKRTVAIGSGAFREIDDHALDGTAHLLVKLLAASFKLNGHHIARNETSILGMVKKWCEHRGMTASPQGYIDGGYSDLLIDSSISIEFDEHHHRNTRQ